MALKATRANVKVGGTSTAMIVPSQLEIGKKSNIAANRLVLADVRGVIPPGDLLEFLEEYIEPNFWPWFAKKLVVLDRGDKKNRPRLLQKDEAGRGPPQRTNSKGGL